MSAASKYVAYGTVDLPDRTWPSNRVTKPPIWCSVDLRDGNQALVRPMDMEQKLRYYRLLVEMGFKEIEVGFPSASRVEFDFTRRLIDENLIPPDVTIQVLTQSRDHLIEKTIEAVKGAPNVIVHLYNSTSPAQREIVFRKTGDQIIQIAIDGTRYIRECARSAGVDCRLEYSAESFSQTELPFARDICDAVVGTWVEGGGGDVIINLPSTVEVSPPNVYADQFEWMRRNLATIDRVILSVHAHNDRGCAVAATELALCAGANRVEGTLFGNGERTGNADLITLCMNLYAQGIDPGIVIGDIDSCAQVVSECTSMPLHPRQPYAGELVYTAFSGSHQDAISKGLADFASVGGTWRVPYLPIDPRDVGRTYEAVIRINSQSGKGGAAYILEQHYGLRLPKAMQAEFGKVVQVRADQTGRELQPDEIYTCFEQAYLLREPIGLLELNISDRSTADPSADTVQVEAVLETSTGQASISGSGNGPIHAMTVALGQFGFPCNVLNYEEHSLQEGSGAQAVAYIQIENAQGKRTFGVGIDTDIAIASARALVSGLNRLSAEVSRTEVGMQAVV